MAPSIKVQGKVKRISDIQTFASGFRKREIVIATEDQYSQFLNIEFVQEKCDLLDPYQESDLVDIDINLRGREWTSPEGHVVYFNTLQGWRIQKIGAENTSGNSTPSSYQNEAAPNKNEEENEDDDLPF